jgi:hypothetical protein
MPLLARICEVVQVPNLVVHDSEAPQGKQPIQAERAVNAAIAAVAGAERTVELAPTSRASAG